MVSRLNMAGYASLRALTMRAGLLGWVCALLLATLPFASAADQTCEQKVAAVKARKISVPALKSVQQQLTGLGYDTHGVDGMMGSATLAALRQFCANSQFALNEDLLFTLQTYVELDKAQAGWAKVLASAEFDAWATQQPDHEAITKIRSSGSSAEVQALLSRYAQQKAALASAAWSPDDPISTYALSDADFKLFRSGSTVFKLIAALPELTYASKQAFDAAVKTVLKDVVPPDPYIQVIDRHAREQKVFKFSAAAIEGLGKNKIPDYVLQPLKSLQDINYPGQEIDAAVASVVGKLNAATLALSAEIVQSAYACDALPKAELPCAKPDAKGTFKLVADSYSKIAAAHAGDLLVAAVIAQLQDLKDMEYPSQEALSAAVDSALKQVVKQTGSFVADILSAAESGKAYGLDKAEMQDIGNDLQQLNIPEIYLQLFGDIQDADYPNADYIGQAILEKIAITGSNNIIRKAIFSVIDQKAAIKIDEPVMEALKAAKLPSEVLVAMQSVPAASTPDALKSNIEKMFQDYRESFKKYLPNVIAQAKKQHPFNASSKIQWNGHLCACVHDNLAGDVYGIYPYWLAGAEQEIDFSVQSRIGFFALGFDDSGAIVDAERWSKQDQGFIREAKTYGSKIDLVIYRNNWENWRKLNSTQRSKAFKQLAANIAAQLNSPLSDWMTQIKLIASFGTHPLTLVADGVTLDFDGYPEDADSVAEFSNFINELKGGLSTRKTPYAINLMFRSSVIGAGIYQYENLLKLMGSINSSDGSSSGLLLVQLQEPTTNDKKILRAKIENGLHGEKRMSLLRKIAMTITYDGHNVDQLTDDVIYANDNFGGIGFWLQPLVSGVAATPDQNTVGGVLHQRFLNVQKGENAMQLAVCNFICPNRWAFRITWDLLILASLVTTAMYFMVCAWRNFIEKNFIYFVAGLAAPTVLLSLALLFCDPFWVRISKGNGPLIFLVSGIIGYGIWSYRNKKKKAKLP